LTLLWGLLLGLIQGATEFIPVSSSAHLAFLGALADISEKDALPFFLILHLGTLLALAVFFAKDILGICRGCLKMDKPSWRLAMMIFATTVPTGIIGLALKSRVEKALVSPAWAASFLLVTAAILFTTRFARDRGLELASLTTLSAVLIGIAQGIAVLPGISRSGSTIAAGLFCGMKRDDAFRYSFLASIPAVGGAFLLDLREIAQTGAGMGSLVIPLSFLAAAVAGFLSLVLLKKIVIRGGLHYFSFYCIFASVCGFVIAFFVGKT